MPSKKERAKQRKAKKVIPKPPTSNNVGDSSGGNGNQQGAASFEYCSTDTLKLLPTPLVVAQVKRGNHSITDALSMTHASKNPNDCQDHLVNVLPVILEFLQSFTRHLRK